MHRFIILITIVNIIYSAPVSIDTTSTSTCTSITSTSTTGTSTSTSKIIITTTKNKYHNKTNDIVSSCVAVGFLLIFFGIVIYCCRDSDRRWNKSNSNVIVPSPYNV